MTDPAMTDPAMTDPAAVAGPRRGRPRSEKARQAILHAAAELLLSHGLGAVSMDTVAERAGVSKATIYRWWPAKETLALDALENEWAVGATDPPDTGTLRDDLLALLHPWAELVTTRPYARVIAALVTKAHTDPAFAGEYVAHLVAPRRDRARTAFTRAIDRGEITPDAPVDVALDLLYGPLYHRLLHGHAPVDHAFVDDVVDLALHGILAAGPTAHPGKADNTHTDSGTNTDSGTDTERKRQP
jgi:AcrR family transcriptional regulator